MKRYIPNIITLCNLLCGVVSAYCAAQHQLALAALFILLGIFFDFFDGMTARLLNVASPLGKELDSLADVVTSGVAPGIILFQLLHTDSLPWLAYIALLTPALAAYRLAKFNLDERQHHGSFLGLPAPANALIWVGVALLPEGTTFSTTALVVMAVVSIFTACMMVGELPMFSLKFNFHNMAWHTNKIRYIFLIGCMLLIAAALYLNLLAVSITAAILWYILLSIFTKDSSINSTFNGK